MRVLLTGLKTVLAIVLSIVLIAVVALIAYAIYSSWKDRSRYQAYSECQARAIEGKVGDDYRGLHLEYCMTGKGYVRNLECSVDQIMLPNCFKAATLWRW
jgi:hypothetical protein